MKSESRAIEPEQQEAIREYEDRLAGVLLSEGKLDKPALEKARKLQQSSKESLAGILVNSGLVSEKDTASVLSELLGLALLESDDYPDLPVMVESFSARFLKHKRVIPITTDQEKLSVVVADPFDHFTLKALALSSGKKVVCSLGLPSDIDAAIERLHGSGKSQMDQIVDSVTDEDDQEAETDVAHLRDLASEAPVIRLVNLIIEHAVEEKASDIHIEPFDNQLTVRYRIDGQLQTVEAPPQQFSAAVVSRIKLMANLDIAERRLPQDGRVRTRVQGKDLDLRVSTVPTLHGESLVIRLLYKTDVVHDFHALGFSDHVLKRIEAAINRPHGIVLVTGPTGSGKTTTLYTALTQLNQPTRKILTVEDPVEYQLMGINQIQVKPQIGLTFASALRSIVRQDPDIIMIGEMRDQETAKIAVQSALTGHLVLSTLHTNDAASSITRLLDMGVDGFLVTSTVHSIVAQRLIRKLCPHCREPFDASEELLASAGLEQKKPHVNPVIYKPVGCDACRGTGYSGRTAILEVLSLSDAIRQLILSHADAATLYALAVEEGMKSLLQDGLGKVLEGITSLEEVLRVTQEA